MIAGSQVKESCIKNNIEYIEHHSCSLCKHMVHYSVLHGNLYFDSNCNCVTYRSAIENKDWSEAADWINMQTNMKHKKAIALKFGITI